MQQYTKFPSIPPPKWVSKPTEKIGKRRTIFGRIKYMMEYRSDWCVWDLEIGDYKIDDKIEPQFTWLDLR